LNQAKIREKEIQRDATDELVKRNKLYANLTVSEEELQKRIDRRAKTVETLERGYLEVARNGAIVRANLSLEQRQQIETTLDGLDREINAIREGIPIRDAIISQLESLTGHQETINEITEEYSELTKSREKTAIQGTIQAIKEKIAKLEEQRDTTGTTLLQIRKYNEEIALLKKQLEQLESGGVIQKVTNSLGQQGAVLGKALVEGPQLTEAQKLAKDALKKVGKAAVEGFQESIESQGERDFFLDTFGISEEKLQAGIELARTALNTLGDIFSAQAEREIAVETNRTNQLNDQLKQRLANENLSADERDKINQEIARNQAQLVAKENEINKKRFEQEKALNISLAIVNTFAAATAVLAQTKGDVFLRVAGMIATIGAGLAQVAIIAKQQFTAKAMPSPNLSGLGGEGGGGAEPQFNVIGATGQNQLAAAIAATQQQPVKAYVVSNDVTTAQSLDRNIVAEASL
jgi:hypothetical protein